MLIQAGFNASAIRERKEINRFFFHQMSLIDVFEGVQRPGSDVLSNF
jgi:hypothetical protein